MGTVDFLALREIISHMKPLVFFLCLGLTIAVAIVVANEIVYWLNSGRPTGILANKPMPPPVGNGPVIDV